MSADALKDLPPVQDVLGHPVVAPLASEHGREVVLNWTRDALQNARQLLLGWYGDRPVDGANDSRPLDRVGWTDLLAEHVQQHARPKPARVQLFVEQLHPERLHQEEIQPGGGALLLDAVDEVIIRVQLVGHDEIINAYHAPHYPAGGGGLSILRDRLGTDW